MEKVMIVDDSEFIRLNIKKILEKIGHEVVATASNGQEALDKYLPMHFQTNQFQNHLFHCDSHTVQ